MYILCVCCSGQQTAQDARYIHQKNNAEFANGVHRSCRLQIYSIFPSTYFDLQGHLRGQQLEGRSVISKNKTFTIFEVFTAVTMKTSGSWGRAVR